MSKADYAKNARLEGREARRADQPQSDNPHPRGTMERTAWNMGWYAETKALGIVRAAIAKAKGEQQ